MRILFIGGTGIISTACVNAALQRGWSVSLLNRGQTATSPPGCHHYKADIRDPEQARAALGNAEFDAVVNWVAFEPEHIETDFELFRDRTGQWVFISSASAYQTPPQKLPVTEDTPLENPFWEYSRQKIACEERIRQAMVEGFPATIVRPSHTYGRGPFPFDGGYTYLNRIRDGQPIIVPGDGTSLWTLTHNTDFALGLLGLLGHPAALGEAFHITGDEWLTWNAIFSILGQHLGREPVLAHVPSEAVVKADAELGSSFWGDKSHSMIFDNSKLRKLVPEFQASVPFAKGARDIIDWYDEDSSRCRIDTDLDRLLNRLAGIYSTTLDSV